MDDRFIGYRGSQENEWSWEPDGATGPARKGTHHRRNLVLAILSACALVAVMAAAIYLLVAIGGDGSESIVRITSTPTRRPTAAPTPPPGPSPAPASPAATAELFLWNTRLQWQHDSLAPGASAYAEGDTIPFMYKAMNLEPGRVYELAISYFECGLWPEQSFDYLGSTDSSSDTPRIQAPGPGRARPDSQVPVPDDPAVPSDNTVTAYLAAWGGTFQSAPVLSSATFACSAGRSLDVRVLAQSSTLYIEWGGHLSSGTDWPGGGAASARTPFGMTTALNGASEARIAVLPNAISR